MSLLHGDKPNYEIFKTKEDETDYLIKALKEAQQTGINLSEIVIAARTREGYKEVKTALHYNQLAFWELSPHTPEKEGVRITTFHNLKGLEFKVVILCDVNSRNCPFRL